MVTILVAGVASTITLVAGSVGTYWLTHRNSEEKTINTTNSNQNIDAHGAINNVIIKDIQDKIEFENKDVIIMLYIMCGIKIITFLIYIYIKFKKRIKSKYVGNNAEVNKV